MEANKYKRCLSYNSILKIVPTNPCIAVSTRRVVKMEGERLREKNERKRRIERERKHLSLEVLPALKPEEGFLVLTFAPPNKMLIPPVYH